MPNFNKKFYTFFFTSNELIYFIDFACITHFQKKSDIKTFMSKNISYDPFPLDQILQAGNKKLKNFLKIIWTFQTLQIPHDDCIFGRRFFCSSSGAFAVVIDEHEVV